MDAYSGYKHICVHILEQENTSFITDLGLYCYHIMSFGLKNASATQWLVNCMFTKLIEKTIEVYVDDMLVKSKKVESRMQNLSESFDILRKYRMKMNLLKCDFGVASGKFCDFMVNARRIEVNPEQIKALQLVKSASTWKEMQSLHEKVAALSRFILKEKDKCIYFFDALKKDKGKFF